MTSVIIGVSSPEQLEDIVKAEDIQLTKDEIKHLTKISDDEYIW